MGESVGWIDAMSYDVTFARCDDVLVGGSCRVGLVRC